MLKKKLAILLFSCLAGVSFGVTAAQTATTPQPAEAVQSQVGTAVNVNTADVETLQAGLIGIGKVKAQAIVDHRTANGPFASVDELLEVKGIGAATLEKNRDRLSVN